MWVGTVSTSAAFQLCNTGHSDLLHLEHGVPPISRLKIKCSSNTWHSPYTVCSEEPAKKPSTVSAGGRTPVSSQLPCFHRFLCTSLLPPWGPGCRTGSGRPLEVRLNPDTLPFSPSPRGAQCLRSLLNLTPWTPPAELPQSTGWVGARWASWRKQQRGDPQVC